MTLPAQDLVALEAAIDTLGINTSASEVIELLRAYKGDRSSALVSSPVPGTQRVVFASTLTLEFWKEDGNLRVRKVET